MTSFSRYSKNARVSEIQRICIEQKIETLVHFTRSQNLSSILQRGLLGRSVLEDQSYDIRPQYNDSYRLDGYKEAICLSISFPNYQMFYKYRYNNDLGLDQKEDWVVLTLAPSILWEMDCKFYTENAASNNARNSEINMDRSQPVALKQMFQDYGSMKRSTLGIPDNFTTHPQAEVLVLNSIPVDYIQSVDFCNRSIAEQWLSQNSLREASCVQFYYSDRYFCPRQDWKFWSTRSLPSTAPVNDLNFDDIPF
jgi:hypothetical protein